MMSSFFWRSYLWMCNIQLKCRFSRKDNEKDWVSFSPYRLNDELENKIQKCFITYLIKAKMFIPDASQASEEFSGPLRNRKL